MSDIVLGAPALEIINGQPTTLSTQVAAFCNKLHKDVLKAIRNLVATAPELDGRNFAPVEIPDAKGELRCAYRMDRKGFVLLAMGFTGSEALKFKIAYIDAFDMMERQLYGHSNASATLSTEEQYEIRKAVKSRAKNSSIHYQTIYNALYDYFKVASYKDLTKAQFAPAITFIQTCDVAPQLEQSVPEGSVVLSKDEAEGLRTFVYCWRYLFRPELEAFGAFLRVCHAPKAGRFREAVHDFNMAYFESILDRHGYAVKELSCYKHLMSH